MPFRGFLRAALFESSELQLPVKYECPILMRKDGACSRGLQDAVIPNLGPGQVPHVLTLEVAVGVNSILGCIKQATKLCDWLATDGLMLATISLPKCSPRHDDMRCYVSPPRRY